MRAFQCRKWLILSFVLLVNLLIADGRSSTAKDRVAMFDANRLSEAAPSPFGSYVESVNGIELEMLRAPNGSFLMGDDASPPVNEKPAHTVQLTSFYMSRYEITRELWNKVVDTLPQVNRTLSKQFIGGPAQFGFPPTSPVDTILWAEAVEFCDRLSRFAGKTYRLPSEAEWEYACRAGTTTQYSFGDTMDYSLVHMRNLEAGDPGYWLLPVGQKGYANPWGFYDMHGNVMEWCSDYVHSGYNGAPTNGSSWTQGGDSSRRIVRGGEFSQKPEWGRSAARYQNLTSVRASGFGFRVAVDLAPTGNSQVSAVSAADYSVGDLAAGSIAAIFGSAFSSSAAVAANLPLPTTLAGASVSFQGLAGQEYLAPLFFASPGQINCQIPDGLGVGPATMRVTRSDGTLAIGNINISEVHPALFSANALGSGPAAGYVLRVKNLGETTREDISHFDAGTRGFVTAPIAVADASEQVFLVLFGTGFRNSVSAAFSRVDLGGIPAELTYAGPQGTWVGLDQCNIRVSSSHAGRGEVAVRFQTQGRISNPVNIQFR